MPETLAYKILTHDYRSPLQGGDVLWDGKTLPYTLPAVKLDTSAEKCAAGWNYVTDLAAGFRIAGLWPTGRPSTVFVVEPSPDAVQRGDKSRCSVLTLNRLATETEIEAAIVVLSAPFGVHAGAMAEEQIAWRKALSRPRKGKEAELEAYLKTALQSRGLPWTLKHF